MAGVIRGIAIIRRKDLDDRNEVGVLNPGADSAIEIVNYHVAGDHGRQLVHIAVIDDLEDLFLGPGGGVLGAEIVQDQQGDLSNFFKALLKAHLRAAIGKPQPVQQVGTVRNRVATLASIAALAIAAARWVFPQP